MQLKGLVKFFTVALILISLYQLSFTFIVQSVERKALEKAKKEARLIDPQAKGEGFDTLVTYRYDKITDSLLGENVFNLLGVKKFTYQELKEQELNLGLDLQGGMNVTLEVSLDELVRSMSNNPKDPALDSAIVAANRLKANSQADFVTLFGEAFTRANPNAKLSYLFTKAKETKITLTSTNDEVLRVIRSEAKDAIKRTYKVLQTRIDKFGVTQPNVNLDENKGIISVELAGVTNPERVREILQATANLQFFVVYHDARLGESFQQADAALKAYLSGAPSEVTTPDSLDQKDTSVTAAANPSDTSSLSGILGNSSADKASADTSAKGRDLENPLLRLLSAQPDKDTYDPAAAGYVAKKNINKLLEYLANDVVKNKMPRDVKFCFGADAKNKKDPNGVVAFYALQTVNGGSPLEGNHVTSARSNVDQVKGSWEISMSMDPTGTKIWKKLTGQNKDNYVAVVLDERVYSAPRIINEIPNGNTSITGKFTAEEAEDLANILNTGKLPAPARIVQEQVVGPTLGAEAIEAGMYSLLISFVVIFLLMLVYYNTAGWVANIALILNLLFTVGILSALHATLTMPGIAGLVLSIGMAVDTNVIIFERIKEELAAGKTYQQAVTDGYKRSYNPVFDGHITILISAVILFIFGLGPVLGFATTQIIGILLSLFCGILVSRLVTDFWTKRERHFKYFTGLSKSVFKKAHFRFVEMRKYTYIISILVLLAGIGSFFNGFDYSVEFQGGRSYTIKFDNKYHVSDVSQKLHNYFGATPIVKTIGSNDQLNITTAYKIEESGPDVEAQVQQKLHEGLVAEKFLPAGTSFETFTKKYIQSSQTVLPTISDDLVNGAKWATILSLFAICAYIFLRFRKWQYSLGTMVSLLHDVCITLAVFSFCRGIVPFELEIGQHFIAAILTVIGFSMNDTVIVFDRIREYFRKSPNENKKTIINRAINDTLSRTIMTSLTVFLTILILFIFGGEVTRGFAFAMLIGVVTGTYSSIFVAAPILVDLDKKDKLKQEVDREAQIEELKKLA